MSLLGSCAECRAQIQVRRDELGDNIFSALVLLIPTIDGNKDIKHQKHADYDKYYDLSVSIPYMNQFKIVTKAAFNQYNGTEEECDNKESSRDSSDYHKFPDEPQPK